MFLGAVGSNGACMGAGARAQGRRGAQGNAHALCAQERRGRWGQRAMA